jgi:hypothetical protein
MNQTERTVPAEIEAAMGQAIMICVDHGNGIRPSSECQRAMMYVRHAIIAALEPERELRERCERLRKVAVAFAEVDAIPSDFDVAYMYLTRLHRSDLADDLTA